MRTFWMLTLTTLQALGPLATNAVEHRLPELRTEVIPISNSFKVGKPMLFRLEAQNLGGPAVFTDRQSLFLDQYSFKVLDKDKKPVPCVAPSEAGHQTMQMFSPLGPGKPKALMESFNLTDGFAIYEPGTYTISFIGINESSPKLKPGEMMVGANGEQLDHKTIFASLPSSKEIIFEVSKGKLTRQQYILKRLHPVVPEGWFLCRAMSGEGVVLGEHGDRAVVWINLQPIKNRKAVPKDHQLLGKGSNGWVAMQAEFWATKAGKTPPPDSTLNDFWPQGEQKIRTALGIPLDKKE